MRVSHVGKRDLERLRSPEEQTAEIEAWAKAQGYRVELLPPELDAKGSDASRPVFRQAVEGVKSGLYSGVVVAYLSRAGRDLRLMLDLWDEVEGVGGVVYSARENIDGSTAAGRLQRNLLASIDQHQREERREGFERARRGAVENGIWQRRQTPRGYDRDPDTRGLVINEQADEVRDAARDFLRGERILALSQRLGMTPGGLRSLLRNRVYLGELKVGRHVNTEAHDPILEPETFEAVQAKLDSGPRPPRSTLPTALLAGLVRCASCGHVMTRSGSRREKVYTCPTNHSGKRCPAPVAINCVRVDTYVEEVALAELDRLEATVSAGDGVERARVALAEAEAELAGYVEAVDFAGLGAADAALGMRVRREQVDAAREALRREMARAPQLPALQGGAGIWADLNHDERNSLLRHLLAAVVVRPVGSGARVAVADRVRCFRYGAHLTLPSGPNGSASGIVPIPWPDADHVDVIGVSG
jgi:DNA invertase Pin-like site-specific DNA recombinase